MTQPPDCRVSARRARGASEAHTAPARPVRPAGVPTVLVVDGGRRGTVVPPGLLESLGYLVRRASNGRDAVRIARAETPAVIILDAALAPSDGYAVCRTIRERPETGEIPMVLVVGQDRAEATRRSLELGVDDLIIRPVEDDDLVIRISSLAERRHRPADLHSSDQVLSTIAAAIEARDSVTGGHCTRLVNNAERFGLALGLSRSETDLLRTAGTLHDVGKVGVPDSILNKPGPLTPGEWDAMKRHPSVGEEILRPLHGLSDALPIVRSHHERWDGMGYPDGLAGSRIPYLARVFQIVDIFDALTSPRHYKPALPMNQAMEIMIAEAGKVIDPDLFAHFAARVASVCEVADPSVVDRVDWDPWAGRWRPTTGPITV